MNKKKRIVVVGGGTGTFTVLGGLKKYNDLHLSAIVSMTDSGGSNRVLRDEFGLLPTSDINQCIVALASKNSNGLLRDLFSYRYNQGTGITGMRFGNLFMAALTDIYGSQKKAIEATCKMLQVQGDVIPVTYDNTNLVARYANGTQVLGEHYIDEPEERLGKQGIVELSVMPQATVNSDAMEAIARAQLIVIGPGDLYTSLICNFVVGDFAKAICKSKAKKIYVMNLMTKFGQTYGLTANGHLSELENYLGCKIDYCLVSKKSSVSMPILKKYRQEHAEVVKDDLKGRVDVKIVRRDFVSKDIYTKPGSDKLRRSLIRHDSGKLAKAIYNLLK